MSAVAYNGTTDKASFGWDTGVEDLNVFYDVSFTATYKSY